MEEKTIKAYVVNGENGCYVFTGEQSYTIDFFTFDKNQLKIEYRFTVEGVQSREDAVTFIQFLFCGDANFINELDKYYNKHIAERAKFFSERILKRNKIHI